MPTGAADVGTSLDENTARFTSIANILDGIRQFALDGVEPGDTLHRSEARRIASFPLKGRRQFPPEAERRLRISWQTELAARVGEAFDDPILRRVAAQTLPVQAYYAIFNAARALTLTAGTPADTHRGVHNDFESQRVRVAGGPWAFTLSGDPDRVETCRLDPAVCDVEAFNPLERSRQPAEYIAAGLLMCRRWQLREARAKWLTRNKKRDGTRYRNLPAQGRAELLGQLKRTTLMDFVYELRRRTNYESADEYGSDATDAEVRRFHDGLLYLAGSGLLLYETQLAQYVGLDVLAASGQQWADSVSRVGPWARAAVEQRVEAIADVIQQPATRCPQPHGSLPARRAAVPG